MQIKAVRLQTQTQVFSASLEKSIAMLILSHAELAANIEQEMQDNPLLEAEFESTQSAQEQDPPNDLKHINELIKLPSSNIRGPVAEEEPEADFSSMISITTLEDHLYQQLYWEVSDPEKRKIGDYIIGNLDKDGFLELTCEEIAYALNISDVSRVKEVLSLIQNFDPPGVATKNFKECLVVQLQGRRPPNCQLAIRIIEGYLNDLGNKRYAVLAKKLGASLDEVNQAASLIASLEPRPARNFRPVDPSIYIEPDLYLRRNAQGQYVIETNKKGLPSIRISSLYRNLLNNPNISREDRQFIKEKVNNAVNFIRNLQQRSDTLTAIGQFILNRQKKFLEGEDSTLVPTTLKDVALHLERCESTISRAISNKYIDTPQGLFPLKFFFSHTAARQGEENVSAYTVQQEMAQLIEEENKESPLSDQDIQEFFHAKGLRLARRTITKYRQTMRIPSSHLRNRRIF